MINFKHLTAAGAVFAALAFPGAAMAADSVPSASEQCKKLRADMGKTLFATTFGTNANDKNAFGKCVSKRAKATDAAETTAKSNASKECKADEAADPAGFATTWGSGKKGANAHGKCVSSKAKAKTAAAVKSQVKATVNAARTCKAQRAEDKSAFAAKWGTKSNAFGKCVSATAKAANNPA